MTCEPQGAFVQHGGHLLQCVKHLCCRCRLRLIRVLGCVCAPRCPCAALRQSITGIHVTDSEPAAKQEAEERQRLMQVRCCAVRAHTLCRTRAIVSCMVAFRRSPERECVCVRANACACAHLCVCVLVLVHSW